MDPTKAMSNRIDTIHASATHFPTENFSIANWESWRLTVMTFAQTKNPRTPLLERLRFLCIVSSNLDEFFEIRVAGLKEQIKLNSLVVTSDGLTARTAYQLVSDEAHALVEEQPCSAQ